MQNSDVSKTQDSSSSSRVTTMAELLQKQKTQFVSVKKGESVSGKVTKLSANEILLDIHAKTEAVVLEKERRIMRQLLRLLKVGETVTATVLNPESDLGYTVVSLRRFLEDALWKDLAKSLQSQEKIPVTVRDSIKGGFIVETQNGITGFLPNSHVAAAQNQQMSGRTIDVVIVDLDRENKKIVFSQKAVTGDEDFKKAKQTLKTGGKITVRVLNITSFGMFVSLPVDTDTIIDGLIHISEISWEKLTDIASLFVQGQELESVVIGFDDQAKRVELSIKRLTKDPFEEAVSAFPVDKKITATVINISDAGIMLDLGTAGGVRVEGMIKKDKVPPGTTYVSGQTITATVSQIDTKKRRILFVPVLKEKPIGYR